MSRIGNAPISIPAGVTIDVSKGNMVTVKGPKGELKQQVDQVLSIKNEDAMISFSRPNDLIRNRAMHGLYRSLVFNMIEGVTEGYKVTLELHGVGYRAGNTGQLLELSLGYSHPIMFYVPEDVKLEAVMEKGQPPKIHLESIDKQLIGQVAAKIRGFRKPEPYKGKGIRFAGEHIRRKQGKTAG